MNEWTNYSLFPEGGAAKRLQLRKPRFRECISMGGGEPCRNWVRLQSHVPRPPARSCLGDVAGLLGFAAFRWNTVNLGC